MDEYDVVVIGGGAAGLSAALVLTRALRQVAVVDAGQPRNAPAAHMHGFLGSDGLPPTELLAAGRNEVAGYGGHLLTGRVDTITPHHPGAGRMSFDIGLNDGSAMRSRRVLVTTGLRDDVPDLPGVRERWGRDLLHCPYCHGHEVRASSAVRRALAHAHLISQWSHDVVYFANGDPLTATQREQLAARAIGVVDTPVARLVVEDDRLSGVALTTGQVVPRAAVFVRPRFVPNDTLLTDLGCATHDNGWVAVDATGGTSIPGVWAAGTRSTAQVITAAGEGRPPPSPSTTTSSTKTCPSPSRTSGSTSPLSIAPPKPTGYGRPQRRSDPAHFTHRGAHQPHAQPTPHDPTTPAHPVAPKPAGPPTKHQLAIMIWIAVFPTLTVLNLDIGRWLTDAGPVLRTFVLATIAVPIVIYGIMRCTACGCGSCRDGPPMPAGRDGPTPGPLAPHAACWMLVAQPAPSDDEAGGMEPPDPDSPRRGVTLAPLDPPRAGRRFLTCTPCPTRAGHCSSSAPCWCRWR